MNRERIFKVLKAPLISEKATLLAEKHNQVVFKVAPDATKPEIKKAVEALFNVKVESVQTDRKSTRLNSSHVRISYAVFCLKKKRTQHNKSRHHQHNT